MIVREKMIFEAWDGGGGWGASTHWTGTYGVLNENEISVLSCFGRVVRREVLKGSIWGVELANTSSSVWANIWWKSDFFVVGTFIYWCKSVIVVLQ